LAYAAEARPDTAYSKKALETAEMTTLRKITRSRLNDRMRIEHIRQLCNTPPINEWILGRRVEWNDHISRRASTRAVKISSDKAAKETLEDRRNDGANPWKLVSCKLQAYAQEDNDRSRRKVGNVIRGLRTSCRVTDLFRLDPKFAMTLTKNT
jgi:hypothetical protein